MTNQKLDVSDAEPGIDHFTIRVSKPKSRGYLSITQKICENKVENGRANINSWVETMRDSSPTRIRPTASLPQTNEKNSWTLNHPSALSMFQQIVSASKRKQIVMFLDYDGTLSPIVEDPDRAFMTTEMRAAVKDVARYFPTAIVTGRSIDKVYSFVRLAGLYYAGSHGMDIRGPSKSHKFGEGQRGILSQPASEFLPTIDKVYKVLLQRTKSIPGATVENNKFCLSIHFRSVEEKMWDALAEEVGLVLNDYPKLRLTQGRKVLEIRPTIKWDKGKALEFLLESLGHVNSTDVLPIYIGDDQTDEDAFEVLRCRGQGIGILVSKVPKETTASYSLQDPTEVEDFLRRLVNWKQMSL